MKTEKILISIKAFFLLIKEKICSFFAKIGEKFSPYYNMLKKTLAPHRRILFTILTAWAVTFFTELTNRRSLWSAIVFAFTRPHLFILNFVIVFFVLSVSLLLKKRKVFLLLFSTIWIAFGVTDFIMRSFRVTPFAATDFALLESVWSIMLVYLKIWQMLLIVAAILVALVLVIIYFVKQKKEAVDFKVAACSIVTSVVLIFGLTSIYHQTGIVPGHFANLPDAYREYGFAYCYTVGIFDRGIDRPEDYSKENVEEILNSIGASTGNLNRTKPNIIFLQLESFFDVNYLNYVTFSENPVPNFTALKKDYCNGFLQVPSIGSGTANTEFEILTGMSLDYFGSAEYPYKTIMQKSTCETIAYNLKEQGYSAHAVHNHSGNFYDRNLVYSNMGFDTFTSVEYMQGVEYNPIGWAKDKVLTGAIINALDSTAGQDLVYAISVQAHGKYPSESLGNEENIDVYGLENPTEKAELKYFVNQLYETDKFIGELLSELKKRPEPYIVCMFGDHLPSLDLTPEKLKNGDLFDTEYVIWSNFGIEREVLDLDAYQLTAYIMKLAGFSNGIFTKLHQNYSENENYYNALEMIEYDVLYGDYDAYNGKQKYLPTDIQMGVEKIRIRDVVKTENGLTVFGDNFTEFSVVEVDGKRLETVFVSEKELIVAKAKFDPDDEISENISVLQVTKNGEFLSEVAYKNNKKADS